MKVMTMRRRNEISTKREKKDEVDKKREKIRGEVGE